MGGHDKQRRGIELAQDPLEHDVAGCRVNSADGLVEEVDAGLPGHDEGDLELLPHALAHVAQGSRGGQAVEVNHGGGLVGVEVGEEPGVFRDGRARVPFRVEEVRVGKVGDDGLGDRAGVVPVDGDASLVVGEDPGEDLEQRGLTASVGSHEADDVARLQGEGEVLQGGDAAITLGEAFDVNEAGRRLRGARGLGGHEGMPPVCSESVSHRSSRRRCASSFSTPRARQARM